MDQITHNVRGAQWLEIVTQCQNRSEGITVKQWLSDNGIKGCRTAQNFLMLVQNREIFLLFFHIYNYP